MPALVCDQCSTPIPAGARFCPTCGDPVTDADRVGGQPSGRVERVQLICPKCQAQALYDVHGAGTADCTCARCQTAFRARVLRVQSKRSAGEKKYNRRRFTIRAKDLNGRDQFVEFTRPNNEDFEMKSRDLIALSTVGGNLRVVQNLTLGRAMILPPPVGCGVGAIVLVIFVGFCAMVGGGGSGSSGYTPASTYTSSSTAATSTAFNDAESFYAHSAINVRTLPGKSGQVVRTLSRGDAMRLGAKDANGWARSYDASGQVEGYVYRASDAVRTTPPVARSSYASSPKPRRSSSNSNGYYTGPRGGCYTYSASGRKRYVNHSYCN